MGLEQSRYNMGFMSTSPTWHVRLHGDQADVARLASLFATGKARVGDHNGEQVLFADAFDTMSEAAEVQAEGDRILSILNGAASAHMNIHSAVTSGAVVRQHADGRRDSTVFASANASFAFGGTATAVVTDADGNVKTSPPPRAIAWAEAALTDRQVEKVLRNMKGEQNFITLYKIFEVIEKDKGKRKDIKAWAANKGVATEDDVQRFADSANDSALSGDAARHEKDFNNPNAGPAMSIAESKKLVFALAKAWLDERIP